MLLHVRLAFRVRRGPLLNAFHQDICTSTLYLQRMPSMIEHGFQPDFPAGTETELAAIQAHLEPPVLPGIKDLRNLLWSSIDNDTSKDLDQVEWAEKLPDGRIRILIGVADVDARVAKGTLLDTHARSETTSVYTGVKVFPMLPAELSEGITSLNENEDRLAMVVEYAVDASGTVADGKAYRALVRNRAQLAYNAVGAWLEGSGPAPAKVAANADLAAQLKLQDQAARQMQGSRFQHGALDLETIETRPVMLADEAVDIARQQKNRATSLIEEFMVAANGVIAKTFDDAGVASIRRIVRIPKRWDRIVEVAEGLGTKLPAEPDSKALNEFLLLQKQKDPDHFPDLSLAVVKLMGPGEYVLVKPNEVSPGPFRARGSGLHAFHGAKSPFPRHGYAAHHQGLGGQSLAALLRGRPQRHRAALHVDGRDASRKVEREMQKRIAAVVLHPRIGQTFSAIVTGVNNYGTFVRALEPHVEGMLVNAGKPGTKRTGCRRSRYGETGLHRS